MTNFAVGQQTFATPPNAAYPGDAVGVPGPAGSSTAGTGVYAATDITVGVFAWIVDGSTGQYNNTTVTQAKGSNTIPVFIRRSQSSGYSNANLAQGWSMTIPQGNLLECFGKGSWYTYITVSYNGSSVINLGDAVFVNTTDGTLAVGVTTQPGFYQTDYVVANNNVVNTFGLNMVQITNVGGL